MNLAHFPNLFQERLGHDPSGCDRNATRDPDHEGTARLKSLPDRPDYDPEDNQFDEQLHG
jgi:hypothetical protein